jgi:hypothetical protein
MTKAKIMIEIASVCDQIKNLLLSKNEKYGNSALDPVRIFSKATSREQILVRIDDKLSRISKGTGLLGDDEDVINDLIGYLVLLKIANKKNKESDSLDFNYTMVNSGLAGGGFGSEISTFSWDGTDVEPVYCVNQPIKAEPSEDYIKLYTESDLAS